MHSEIYNLQTNIYILISQLIVLYCRLQIDIQNYDLNIVDRRVACKQINHS